MDHTTFDNLARIFATTRSRRQVLKGLFASATGGAVLAAGFARNLESAAAQDCTPDDGDCSSDDECCSGSCDDSGTCVTPADTCIEDGGLCQAGRYCCSGEDCAPGGHCPITCTPDDEACTSDDECCSGACDGDSGICFTPQNSCIEDGGLCQAGLYCCSGLDCAPGGHCPITCTPDNGTCTSDDECCSGSCDNSGYCYTPENSCIEDGGLCQAGRYCCSGEDCAPGGHCPVSETVVLPATGTGIGGGHDSASSLTVPIATLGAAAVVAARRLRSSPEDQTSA